jgi:site-specific DNA-cytosine methylase
MDPLEDVPVANHLGRNGRLNVVDLFCGCGGMSLGFERYRSGQVFRTALALDIEAPMVRVCWRRPKTEPLLRVVPTQN